MAKVYGGVFLASCVFFLVFIHISPAFGLEQELDYEVYSNLPQLKIDSINSVVSRLRRQAIGTAEATTSTVPPSSNVNISPVTTAPTAALEKTSNRDNSNETPPSQVQSSVAPLTPVSATGGGITQSTVTNASPTPSQQSVPNGTFKDQPLLGINGTGQRKYYPTPSLSTTKPTVVSDPITPTLNQTNGNGVINTPTTSASLNKFIGSDNIFGDDDINIDNVDQLATDTNKTLFSHNITQFSEEYHVYYNSTTFVDEQTARDYWNQFNNLTVSTLLSKSHRRAMTVQLTFDFPFYGHPIRNITIATGGFLYTGEYVHSWLAATQYIAPLMANFDTSLSNNSYVKFLDNGTSFTVLWDNVYLQDNASDGPFTFSASLHKSGDIIFVYYSVPMPIEAIKDEKHPVKVGLSDAYISDKTIFFARKKTIYEYHRVTFGGGYDIKNGTIVHLSAQPTCLSLLDCEACLTSLTTFKCNWCPTVNRCSTGIDRRRHDWVQKGCEKVSISETVKCPKKGEKGNNAAEENTTESTSTITNNNSNENKTNDASNSNEINPSNSLSIVQKKNTQLNGENLPRESSGVGTVLGVFIPIALIMIAVIWVFYAYRNPHTKSGQFLIQYRPSQWSWRRGEARYTAATIHM